MNKEQFKAQEHFSYEDLLWLVRLLRSPEGCPWDREQTHASVRRGVIEEAYEVAEAIDRADNAMMVEELGDLMMQVLFHGCIGEEQGEFTLQEVYDRICRKLIFRHPHIFGDAPDAQSSTEEGWLAIKRQEKGQQTLGEELSGIARTLPALTRAEKIAGRTAKNESFEEAAARLREQAGAFCAERSAEQLGALLFTAAELAKKSGIDPEAALEAENTRIIRNYCENL